MENEAWYETLLELYKCGIINEAGLDEAVALGWVSSEEKYLIVGECAKLKLD